MLHEDDEDLIGEFPKKRGPGRPRGKAHEKPIGPLSPRAILHSELKASTAKLDKHLEARRKERDEANGHPSMHLSDVHAGVTVAWLSQVFGMDPTTVKKRLADCPPLHRRKAGYVYDLKQAAAFLVKPVFDVNKYLRGMKPSELPPQLTKEYWDAALKRQTWEERAGDLWRTQKVIEILSDTFLMMKSTLQLWPEDIERSVGLTNEQRAELVRLVDQLQNELYRNLVELKSSRRTGPMREEIEIDDPFQVAALHDDDVEDEDLIG